MAGRARRLAARAGPAQAPRPWSRPDRAALATLCVLVLASLAWLVHPWSTKYVDAAIYVSTARALAAGEGYTYLGQPFLVRPPGFPLLLAPAAAAGASFHTLNLWVASLGGVALILLFCWARPRQGPVLALLACIAVGSNPVFRRLSSELLSDVPGLCLALAVLLFHRRTRAHPSLGADLALGSLIAVASYVRAINLLLLPAVLALRAVHPRDPTGADTGGSWRRAARRFLPVGATTLLLIAPWVHHTRVTPVELPVDQLANHSYATSMLHVDHGDPTSPRIGPRQWKRRLAKRPPQIAASLATRLADPRPTGARLALGATILAAYLAWLVATPTAAGFFVLCCLLVTGTYFAYEVRLLLPVFALLVPALSEAMFRALSRWWTPRIATLATALPLAALPAVDFAPRAGWEAIRGRHERMTGIAAELSRELPADARLATTRSFQLGVLMQRPVHSLRWAERLGPGLEGVEALVDRHGIDTLLLDPRDPRDRRLAPEVRARYGAGREVAGMEVFEVR